ncbi:hypothetical protein [Alicyclobacillus sp. SO9]|uniref:hypothetical protein n=1 Tax=Alicyclobacillus sp. SO9 TaxID=2665646 RepID=UPI0018E85862|nr:hypothetical protein [Alicyclobacillus sp. SO9]QQE78976.1 hypothetical protein GI364_00135 [Alicyclobacillus sp. SO9]
MQRKSRFLTFVLSFVPGLGHLYLGLNRRGLQFMIAAFACVILSTMIPLIFPSVLAIVWFYSLFDALQKALVINIYAERNGNEGGVVDNPYDSQGVNFSHLDHPIVPAEFMQGRRGTGPVWIGGLSILIGVLVLIRQVFPHIWSVLIRAHGGTIVLAAILIGFGIWLIRTQMKPTGRKTSGTNDDRSDESEL